MGGVEGSPKLFLVVCSGEEGALKAVEVGVMVVGEAFLGLQRWSLKERGLAVSHGCSSMERQLDEPLLRAKEAAVGTPDGSDGGQRCMERPVLRRGGLVTPGELVSSPMPMILLSEKPSLTSPTVHLGGPTRDALEVQGNSAMVLYQQQDEGEMIVYTSMEAGGQELIVHDGGDKVGWGTGCNHEGDRGARLTCRAALAARGNSGDIMILWNPFKVLQGILKGFDQATNIILDESHERVYSTKVHPQFHANPYSL
ncbi:hypothetical protein Taro_032331 [Colocasia esculenta]|uniref:Sm domain-containing protein n=1 Tax=Colocasia esculenta TaxID=4460 RepID=A0A843VYY1_COLES|nr:hypothetical protein [Colocasia esculenta]